MFKIFSRSMVAPVEVSADGEEEMKEWIDQIMECTSNLKGDVSIVGNIFKLLNEHTVKCLLFLSF